MMGYIVTLDACLQDGSSRLHRLEGRLDRIGEAMDR